jgi:Uma2 family endonuclease
MMPHIVKEPYTYLDLENFPEDGLHREIIGGELFVTAAPSTRHQKIVGELFFIIRTFLQSHPVATVFMAPTEVLFDSQESVQPDVFVVFNEGSATIAEKRVMGAPDWIIEVLSPATHDYDLDTKRKLYQRYGVVYWVVDPVDEEIVVWDEGRKKVYSKSDEVRVSVLPEFGLKVADIRPLAKLSNEQQKV